MIKLAKHKENYLNNIITYSTIMSIPIYKKKYNSKAVLTPKKFLEYRKKRNQMANIKIPKLAILCYNSNFIKDIKKRYNTEMIKWPTAKAYYIKDYDVLVLSEFGIGSPSTAMLLEDLIAYGIKNFITIGNAGGISDKVKVGDIILCDKAIRDEGVSYHYIKDSMYAYPRKGFFNKVKKHLDKDFEYKIGASWTHDVFYRETIDEIRYYKKKEVLTTELEAASVFAIAQYREVNVAVVFVVSDSMADLEWNPGWDKRKKVNTSKKVLDSLIGLEV
jgi:uridine phosphorylase